MTYLMAMVKCECMTIPVTTGFGRLRPCKNCGHDFVATDDPMWWYNPDTGDENLLKEKP